MIIRRFITDDFMATQAQPRQRYELSAYLTRQYAELLASGIAYTALDGTTVLACGGILSQYAGIGSLWAVLGEASRPHLVGIVRGMRRIADMAAYRRLEASSEANFPQGCRMLELLGFECEGPLRSYGPDGKDHIRYARIRAAPAAETTLEL